ncbi:MAG: 4-(cytidine 5'-diphospho)-2-C-methyl-D-erythritol kinase [Rubrivivax sp.]
MKSLLDVPAPAKLNLFLHVLGRRSDGYHLLESVFVLIDWADTLHFERRDDGALRRHDLAQALPPDDLCLRAARALQAASGTGAGADISILKQVPSGAGMGGGSSDAATVLLALNRLWGLHWPRQRLLHLAAGLGADVPFFVFGRNALVQGVGEQLSALEVPAHLYAVVKPAACLPTADIFNSPLLKRDSASVIVKGSLVSEALAWLAGPAQAAVPGAAERPLTFGRNDLQLPAQSRCAEVAQAARLLDDSFGNSRMTGSGSAVFARIDTGVPPEATWPQALPPGWVGRLCRGLPQHPLLGWAD